MCMCKNSSGLSSLFATTAEAERLYIAHSRAIARKHRRHGHDLPKAIIPWAHQSNVSQRFWQTLAEVLPECGYQRAAEPDPGPGDDPAPLWLITAWQPCDGYYIALADPDIGVTPSQARYCVATSEQKRTARKLDRPPSFEPGAEPWWEQELPGGPWLPCTLNDGRFSSSEAAWRQALSGQAGIVLAPHGEDDVLVRGRAVDHLPIDAPFGRDELTPEDASDA